MSSPTSELALHIKRIEIDVDRWSSTYYTNKPCLDSLGRAKDDKHAVVLDIPGFYPFNGRDGLALAIVRFLYDKKVGQLGCVWRQEGIPVEFKHAKVKFGDLFDFYTSADGVLQWPDWCSMRLAVDEFLEQQDARTKFHPSRVQQFIDENGIDHLELME